MKMLIAVLIIALCYLAGAPSVQATSVDYQSMRVVAYQIVSGNTNDLAIQVTELLKKGWQPLGPPLLLGAGFQYMLAQAMVQYE